MFRVFKLGLIFPVVLLSGCVLTTEMWEPAFSRSAYLPTIAGIARTNDTASLVVFYSLPVGNILTDDRKFYVVLALDDEFHVPYQYEYLGTNRAATNAPTRQIEQVRSVRFSATNLVYARKLVEGGSFIAVNTSSNGVRAEIGWHIGHNGVAELEYWIGERGRESGVTGSREIKFPDKSHILLLPSSVHRPGGEYAASVAGGLVKTPFYLLADVFFDPYLAFEFMFVGIHEEGPTPSVSPPKH